MMEGIKRASFDIENVTIIMARKSIEKRDHEVGMVSSGYSLRQASNTLYHL